MSEEKIAGESKKKDVKKIRKGPKVVGKIIVFLLVITGLWFGAVKGLDTIKYVSTDDASIDGQQIKLSSRMLGRISRINVREGQKVKSGDVLVALNAASLKAQEAQAQASLAYARENLKLTKINLEKTRNDYTRIRNLYNHAAATKENYDHAASALDAYQTQYNIAKARIDTSAAQLGVIETQLLNTSIRTPISGTVDKISLFKGDVVQPGQTILTVNNLDDVWVIANVKETSIRKVRIGAKVKVIVDALGRKPLEGTVELVKAGIVAPAFQIGDFTKTTQRIPVRIRLTGKTGSGDDGQPQKLLPGMSAEVKIRTPAKLPAFLNN